MIINMRRVVLLLPVYVVLMVSLDSIFNSARFKTDNDLPWWLLIGFTLAALAVFLIVAWFLAQKARGKVPVQRERVYAGFLGALIISGFVDDGLRGLASLLFHSRSIWISIPLYILSYVVLLAVLVLIVNKVAAKPSSGTAESSG
jgi:H+/Cl- antiporter ClcA